MGQQIPGSNAICQPYQNSCFRFQRPNRALIPQLNTKNFILMAALCHFPPPYSTQSLSKLISHVKHPIRNPSLTFSKFDSNLQRFSPLSSSSTIASTSALTEFDSVAASLGDVVRADFPILHQTINGNKLVYLDNAATSQKPSTVLKVLNESHNLDLPNGNMSANAFDAYELARGKVAAFINAVDSSEIVFTSNATEAINMVAYSWGLSNLKSGDEILLTVAEHHSNIVPWQLIAQRTGAILKFVGLTEEVPDINLLKNLISEKTKLVVTHHVSNMLGSIMPIHEIVSWSHSVGAKVLVDACQSVPHMVVDVQKLGADFLVASSHKMCGPTGVGFLYGKKELLSEMTPLDGGEMLASRVQANSTSAEFCPRFETGTPPVAQAIGLGAAVDYMSSIGMQKIHDYEIELANYLYRSLLSIPNVHIYGPVPSETVNRAALCSFNVENIHPTDIATFLDEQHGVAIRSGHHCAQLLHRNLGINASARASLHFYNTKEEVDVFIHGLKDTISFFSSYL